jgi:hypothetical protein
MQVLWDAWDGPAWDAAIAAAGGAGLQQSAGYGAAMSACGARVRRALVRDAGRDVALAQVVERRGLRLILRGPVWLCDCDRRQVLRRLARHAGPVVATPEEAVAGLGLVPLVTPRHHALWDITPAPGALRAAMDPRWRHALARAERAGPRIGRNRQGALAALIAAEGDQRRARGYRALPATFTRAFAEGDARAVTVLDWRQDGRTEAAIALLHHGSVATYHLAWAGPKARAAGLHRVMLWQAALSLRTAGVRRIDLGDVNSESAPGLALFKLGTGAALHRLGATVWVLPA